MVQGCTYPGWYREVHLPRHTGRAYIPGYTHLPTHHGIPNPYSPWYTRLPVIPVSKVLKSGYSVIPGYEGMRVSGLRYFYQPLTLLVRNRAQGRLLLPNSEPGEKAGFLLEGGLGSLLEGWVIPGGLVHGYSLCRVSLPF